MKNRLKTFWEKLKITVHFRIFKELIYWAIVMICYEGISLMVTATETMVNYVGFFFMIVLLTFVIKKVIDYGKIISKTLDL